MIAYFDTSALVPLLIEEQGSDGAAEVWSAARRVTAVRLLFVEATAALALAVRVGRLDAMHLAEARERLRILWDQVEVIEIDVALVEGAADAAVTHGLRGYDAVQFAAAVSVADDSLVAASGDRALVSAWQRVGVATATI